MIKKSDLIQPVYNDGVATFKTIEHEVDEFNSPIRNGGKEVEQGKLWFRYLGVTASDTYYAHADDADITIKIAVRGNRNVNSKWVVYIRDVKHEVYRVYFNPKKNETEISLMEV